MSSIDILMVGLQQFLITTAEILPAPLTREILREIELSPEQFRNVLEHT